MGRHKIIPFDRGSSEYEQVRTQTKWEKHHLKHRWRLDHLFAMAKSRAKNKKEDFLLSKDNVYSVWDEQEGLCAITGRRLDLTMSKQFNRNPHGPSIDKIDPSKEYSKENIRLVTTQVNGALNVFGYELFLKMCQEAITYNKDTN
jgi:hypothetical protein